MTIRRRRSTFCIYKSGPSPKISRARDNELISRVVQSDRRFPRRGTRLFRQFKRAFIFRTVFCTCALDYYRGRLIKKYNEQWERKRVGRRRRRKTKRERKQIGAREKERDFLLPRNNQQRSCGYRFPRARLFLSLGTRTNIRDGSVKAISSRRYLALAETRLRVTLLKLLHRA